MPTSAVHSSQSSSLSPPHSSTIASSLPPCPLSFSSPSTSSAHPFPSSPSPSLSPRLLPLLLLCVLLLLLSPPLVHCASGRDFYKILGLKRDAKEADIKKAYRSLSKTYHPDKNPGDEVAHVKFLDVAAAYEVLSDKGKRRVYDQGGEEGLKEQEKRKAGGGGDPFGGMFGHMFGGQREQGERRGDDLTLDLVVTLEELYLGAMKEVRVFGRHLCEHCRGSGADSEGDVHQCGECGGKGHTIIMQPIGPGFMQQIQQTCNRCGGAGRIIKRTCHVCHGRKTQRGSRTLDIQVEQGMADDAKIEFEHAGDESPDHAAGHIIFRVQTAPHANFTRRKDDLHYVQRLTLLQSLVGFDVSVRQLDGREVRVSSNDVTPHGHVTKVKGEGMPHHTVPSQRGDLYVRFEVDLPKTLTEAQKDGFAQILRNVK